MAKDKKSFILYCDQQGVFNMLPDEQAGKLIKHIFAYVNDEEPTSEDLLLTIAFESIKTQLKRDLRKYENYIDKQKENGRKGGRPKTQPFLDETQKTQAFFLKPKKADNVNVNVNENVIIKENIKENPKRFVPPTAQEVKAYMQEQGMDDLSEKWLAFYESKGWLIGKNKMKDWKAAVRTWKTNSTTTTAPKPLKASLHDE
jgi:hypothetical protein